MKHIYFTLIAVLVAVGAQAMTPVVPLFHLGSKFYQGYETLEPGTDAHKAFATIVAAAEEPVETCGHVLHMTEIWKVDYNNTAIIMEVLGEDGETVTAAYILVSDKEGQLTHTQRLTAEELEMRPIDVLWKYYRK